VKFELDTTDGRARRGRLVFERGTVETPAFMPVGTYGTVKGMTPEEVEATGAQIILGNTFHLWLRPGQEIMKLHGDLHDFRQQISQQGTLGQMGKMQVGEKIHRIVIPFMALKRPERGKRVAGKAPCH